MREREEIVYASADVDRVSHMAGPGDVNAGKAWRTVRRPSDMVSFLSPESNRYLSVLFASSRMSTRNKSKSIVFKRKVKHTARSSSKVINRCALVIRLSMLICHLVLGVKGIHLPLPEQPTAMTCTLNNGIHYVTTPDCKLAQDCRIEQEFEL